MKIFHKQLFILLILVLTIVGTFNYYFFFGLNDIIDNFSEEKAFYLARDTRAFLETDTALNKVAWNQSENQATRSRFLEFSRGYPAIQDFFVFSGDSTIVFSFLERVNGAQLLKRPKSDSTEIVVVKRKSDFYQASWHLKTNELLTANLIINPTLNVRDSKRTFMIQIFLISVGAVICAILIAGVMGKGAGTPMKIVEKAMSQIDKRKYGFRIKSKSSDEFHLVFEKVDRALMRLEQLDSVQRTAVQKKNSLTTEMRTMFKYLDVMAHEVKNPLHALVLNTDVLKTKIQKERAKAESLKHVKIIELEIEHLSEVIDGFLRYFRPGVPQKEKLQINSIVSDVCKMASADAGKGKIKIETRFGKSMSNVMVDSNQMGQVFHNLMINAIHASPEGSKISIRTWEKARKIMISIKDNGAGIAKEELKKIFDLYYTTKKQGSGIGLPVTKRIVEANGGQLQFESKVGKGTIATVIINTV